MRAFIFVAIFLCSACSAEPQAEQAGSPEKSEAHVSEGGAAIEHPGKDTKVERTVEKDGSGKTHETIDFSKDSSGPGTAKEGETTVHHEGDPRQ